PTAWLVCSRQRERLPPRGSLVAGRPPAPTRPGQSCSGSLPGCAEGAAPRSIPMSSSRNLLDPKPLVRAHHAHAHHHFKAALLGDPPGLIVHDVVLEPQ